MMSKLVFKTIGVMWILLGIFLLVLFFVNSNARKNGGHNLSNLIFVFPLPVIIGIDLIKLRKWAACVVSLSLAASALWLISGSIKYVSFPWTILNITLGIFMILPTAITIRHWNELH